MIAAPALVLVALAGLAATGAGAAPRHVKAKGDKFLADQPTSLWDPNNSTKPPEHSCVWN